MRTVSIACLVASVLPLGCASIEGSIKSASESAAGAIESLASPFQSLSKSSGSSAAEADRRIYHQDVLALTVAYLEEPEVEPFVDGLGRVAREHGVNDWEADDATFTLIEETAAATPATPEARARLNEELRAFDRSSR